MKVWRRDEGIDALWSARQDSHSQNNCNTSRAAALAAERLFSFEIRKEITTAAGIRTGSAALRELYGKKGQQA